MFVDRDGLVMNGDCMLMGGTTPLLMTGLLAGTFIHNF
jgi:hypothetical protein